QLIRLWPLSRAQSTRNRLVSSPHLSTARTGARLWTNMDLGCLARTIRFNNPNCLATAVARRSVDRTPLFSGGRCPPMVDGTPLFRGGRGPPIGGWNPLFSGGRCPPFGGWNPSV